VRLLFLKPLLEVPASSEGADVRRFAASARIRHPRAWVCILRLKVACRATSLPVDQELRHLMFRTALLHLESGRQMQRGMALRSESKALRARLGHIQADIARMQSVQGCRPLLQSVNPGAPTLAFPGRGIARSDNTGFGECQFERCSAELEPFHSGIRWLSVMTDLPGQ
jgi:hypothetical protein